MNIELKHYRTPEIVTNPPLFLFLFVLIFVVLA